MCRFVLALLLAFACARFSACTGAAAAELPEPVLVTPAWLADRLQDPKLVVLHVSSMRGDYTREHITGARFLWPMWFAISTPDLGFEMPPVDSLGAVLRRLGVSNDSEVVLYHVLGDVAGAARVFVTLDYLGMGGRTKILDGGLAAWKAAGRSLTREEPKHEAGSFVPKVREEVVYRLGTMISRYDAPEIQVLDARAPQDYNAVEGLSVFRGGHIPHAINLPMAAVLDSLDRYQPLDSLAARFRRAGVKPENEIITYCGSGRTACPVYVAARMLGCNVHLYDGSFQEWSRKLDLPVENTKKK